MTNLSENKEDRVYFEAVLCSETGESMFAPDTYLEPNNLQEFVPPAGRGIQAANILQSLGFKVSQIYKLARSVAIRNINDLPSPR